jgi:hypothetical protein
LIGLDSRDFALYIPADFDEAGGIASGAARFFRRFRQESAGGARGMGPLDRENSEKCDLPAIGTGNTSR